MTDRTDRGDTGDAAKTTADIVHRVTLPLAPQAAFDVLVLRIADWWPDPSRRPGFARNGAAWHLAPGAGGRLTRNDGDGPVTVAEVEVWEAGLRLALRLTGVLPGTVTLTFEACGTDTRVTLNHRGWIPVLDPDVPMADAIGRWVEDPWAARIAALRAMARAFA